jgi:hypothetical protein
METYLAEEKFLCKLDRPFPKKTAIAPYSWGQSLIQTLGGLTAKPLRSLTTIQALSDRALPHSYRFWYMGCGTLNLCD